MIVEDPQNLWLILQLCWADLRLSGKELIIWHDQKFEESQYAQTNPLFGWHAISFHSTWFHFHGVVQTCFMIFQHFQNFNLAGIALINCIPLQIDHSKILTCVSWSENEGSNHSATDPYYVYLHIYSCMQTYRHSLFTCMLHVLFPKSEFTLFFFLKRLVVPLQLYCFLNADSEISS